MQLRSAASLIASSALLIACGDSGGSLVPDSGIKPDTGAGDAGTVPDPDELSWDVKTVLEGPNAISVGDDMELALASDGTIGMVYFQQTTRTRTCTLFGAPPVTLTLYDIMYSESFDNGETWSTATAVAETDNQGFQRGLSVAFDPQGNPGVAFMGGADGMFRCGASDLILATRGGSNWSTQALATAGQAATAFDEDGVQCAAAQDYCNVGDAVGEWPSLAHQNGQWQVAYRDIHNAFNSDDETRSDCEMLWNGQQLAVDAPWGGGKYAALAFNSAGNPVVAHANRGDAPRLGIWVIWYDGSEWQRHRLTTSGATGPRLRLQTFGDRMSLVYHDEEENKLIYHESDDGMNWRRTAIDQSGNTGRSPSLALDSAGNPAVAYRDCGAFDPNNTNCETQEDRLRFRVRRDGAWSQAVDIKNERNAFDALFVSMIFTDENLPVIAYKATFADPQTSEQFSQVVVARGYLE